MDTVAFLHHPQLGQGRTRNVLGAVIKGWRCLKKTRFREAMRKERKDRHIQRTAETHRTASAAETRAATVAQRTVRYRLLQEQLQARHSVACILLTPSHCRLRR
ncbi:hypothetical protein TNCV_5063051 [Trichonephila clavipes]|nr:hypothetical protein TNCV_5063051 [Trichonephila clavipes]